MPRGCGAGVGCAAAGRRWGRWRVRCLCGGGRCWHVGSRTRCRSSGLSALRILGGVVPGLSAHLLPRCLPRLDLCGCERCVVCLEGVGLPGEWCRASESVRLGLPRSHCLRSLALRPVRCGVAGWQGQRRGGSVVPRGAGFLAGLHVGLRGRRGGARAVCDRGLAACCCVVSRAGSPPCCPLWPTGCGTEA